MPSAHLVLYVEHDSHSAARTHRDNGFCVCQWLSCAPSSVSSIRINMSKSEICKLNLKKRTECVMPPRTTHHTENKPEQRIGRNYEFVCKLIWI